MTILLLQHRGKKEGNGSGKDVRGSPLACELYHGKEKNVPDSVTSDDRPEGMIRNFRVSTRFSIKVEKIKDTVPSQI